MKILIDNREFQMVVVKEFMTPVGFKARIHKRIWKDEVKKLAPSLHDYCTGYVRLPEGTPKRDNWADVLEVHGGVTFEGKHPDVTGIEGEWIGFDLGHAWDDQIVNQEEYAEGECKRLALQLFEQIPPLPKPPLVLTEEEKAAGWTIVRCPGNGYVPACGKLFKRLNWHTPSGCPNCHATFVD